ncbi:MAG: efflux RND transporter periplasmic adaptor subunit [Rhodothermales bacterium]
MLRLLALTLLIAGCTTQAQTPEPVETRTVPVRTAQVTEGQTVAPIRSSGRLASKAEVTLSFKIGGIVAALLVEEGDRVQKGQLLARLDLAEIDAQVRQAEAGLTKAERDMQRMDALLRDSVVTLEQWQNTGTARDVAQAAVDVARFNKAYAEIRAPASGRILKREVEQNELVGAGLPIVTLGSDADGWVVRVGLADRDIVKLKRGDRATLHFDAYDGQPFAGVVTEIADAADAMTGTFEVEVAVREQTARLKSGFIARVDLFPSDGSTTPFIPLAALAEADGTEATVFTPDAANTTAERHRITVGRIVGDHVAVRSGLTTGQSVITDGNANLADGTLIEVIE